jgi:CRISPR-associated endonuclease/helicase Cas3
MNIILISQCSKNALSETRRILDQFAERKGDRVWQTPITMEGLKTLRTLLKRNARRNTAVACHWVRGRNHTELLWIAGNIRRFNRDGTVPTNRTTRSFIKNKGEELWRDGQAIAILSGIAGLFHDLGKGNSLFQTMISGDPDKASKIKGYQPYRHEWLSFLIFISFAAGKKDSSWLDELKILTADDAHRILGQVDFSKKTDFFTDLSPLAKTIAWLIVSHHRLPTYQINGGNRPQLDQIASWLDRAFGVSMNASNHIGDWSEQELVDVHTFPHGLAMASNTWQQKARQLAKRALDSTNLEEFSHLDQVHTLHISRLVLMLADHCYSAGSAQPKWQDASYKAVANKDRFTGEPKQKLDEHCVGVAYHAYSMARRLSKFRQFLPAISNHKGFKRRTKPARFQWQNKAYDLACSVRVKSQSQGFFGINMASTGCGKTLGNGRIMYALADEQTGCRFSVALGLRTLTLQTGDALRERLHLAEDDLAVLIGSKAVQKLHDAAKEKAQAPIIEEQASIDPEPEEIYVSYSGGLDDGFLAKWLKDRPKVHALVSAPITVSTIDYLIAATEGVRGGKQIGPMLRLLTSDLVLDEPDDFDLDDLKALTRLVNWAGMLGSRVLISSATISPTFVQALFEAYNSGRKEFNKVNGNPGSGVITAWFDEFSSMTHEVADKKEVAEHHQKYINVRQRKLQEKLKNLRRGELVPLAEQKLTKQEAIQVYSQNISQQIQKLHSSHHLKNDRGQTVSVGLVRMANIEPLIAVGLELLSLSPPANHRVHYCFYHSRHPLAIRSMIERRLDAVLMRDGNSPESIFSQPDVAENLQKSPEQHHILVVLATAVAEVGRDHDYDWAIVEPSSMRSIIQLAGRVQRHRQQEVHDANVMIFSKNIKALCGIENPYSKPGFQRKELPSIDTDLQQTLQSEDYKVITARPRFLTINDSKSKFVKLEHAALIHCLLKDEKNKAAFWWQDNSRDVHLFGEMQMQQRFRQSQAATEHFLFVEDGETIFRVFDSYASQYLDADNISRFEMASPAEGVGIWFATDIEDIYENLATQFDMSVDKVAEQFGTLSLEEPRVNEIKRWNYHPFLGAFEGRYLNKE